MDIKEGVVTVRMGESVATLPLSSAPVAALLGELQQAHQVLANVATDPAMMAMVKDDAPDSFTFALRGLADINAKFGAQSTTAKASLALVDAGVATLHTRLTALYPSSLLAQVVLLGVDGHAAPITASARRLFQAEAKAAGSPVAPKPTVAVRSIPTADEIGEYQIMAWLTIVLFFTALSASCALGGMSNKKDTLLYSTFNPKWEDKKTK
jgi:hypothetical protein